MIESALSFGFLMGLFGFAHCAGMCGGLCAALTLRRGGAGTLLFLLLYQVGRVSTYTLLGWAGAKLGAAALNAAWFATATRALLYVSDALLILMGLWGLGLLPWIRIDPETSAGLLAPAAKAVAYAGRAPAPVAGLALGTLFGFIPCGFLYPVLIGAALTADPLEGSLIMFAFGLGTAPALLLAGAGAAAARRTVGRLMPLAWIAVVGLGAFNLYRHLAAKTCCG